MILDVENLRKVYRIHEHQATTLKEMALKHFLSRGETREHVALDGLTFRLGRGRSLGVVGHNGSGKSTLLKLVAGITQPTAGRVELRGRVASLLELGAGFQHEFTGMENIFLQGRILGLSRPDILRRLDAIIEFSGLGDFIHTPTKRYSTGMVVRLGFAIAAHFDADLLLVDEVLAVGDGEFQTRCLERIAELRRQGTSLLFVSHDFGHVEQAAEDVLWIDGGKMRMMGPAEEVLLACERAAQGIVLAEGPAGGLDLVSASLQATVRQGTGEVLIRDVVVQRADGRPARQFAHGEPIRLRFECEIRTPVPAVELWFALGDPEGHKIAITHSGLGCHAPAFPPLALEAETPGRRVIEATLDSALLPPGHYILSCSVNPAGKPMDFLDMHLRMYRFQVVESRAMPASRARSGTFDTPPPLRAALDSRPSSDDNETESSSLPLPPDDREPRPSPRPLFRPPAVWEIAGAILHGEPPDADDGGAESKDDRAGDPLPEGRGDDRAVSVSFPPSEASSDSPPSSPHREG